MFLKREAHVQNDHARLAVKAAAAPSGNGSAIALFLATFSLCLWGGGAFVAKEKLDAMRADLARLSTVAAANPCAAENIAAGGNASSRAIAAANSRTDEPFLISQSPLFLMNRLD